jgi:hypothetical protein
MIDRWAGLEKGVARGLYTNRVSVASAVSVVLVLEWSAFN